MGDGHSHANVRTVHEKRLWIVLGLTTGFLIAEVVGALVTKSLALLSDAAHMFTDAAALAVALVAIRIGKKVADRKRTFGYQRFEILAAVYNASLLFLVAIYILYEAVQRFMHPQPIQSGLMLVIAALGLAVNLAGMWLLRDGSTQSLNVKGAYLEVWSDMLASLGVIAAAALIEWTGLVWIDSLVAVGIGLWVLPRTWILMKESINVLLQGVPHHIDIDALERTLGGVTGVVAIHSLHVWSLTSGQDVLSAHIVIDSSVKSEQEVLAQIERVMRPYDIHNSTIQIEARGFHECAASRRDSGGQVEH